MTKRNANRSFDFKAKRPVILLLLAAFALFLFAGLCPAARAQDLPPGPPPNSRIVKIMSINVRHNKDFWEERFPLIADEIVRLRPDVIGVQEMLIGIKQSRKLQNLIAEKSGGQLKYEVYEHLKTGKEIVSGEGVSILSRYPMEKKTFEDLNQGRVVVAARIDLGEGLKIDMLNTHLHNTNDEAIKIPQAEKIVALAAKIDSGNVAFLTGDMNSLDNSLTIKKFLDNSFIDTYKKHHGEKATRDNGNTSPVLMVKKNIPNKQTHRIDFIFLKTPAGRENSVRILDSVVCFKNKNAEGLFPSDHLGVMTTVEIFY